METFNLKVGNEYYDIDPTYKNATRFRLKDVSMDTYYMELVSGSGDGYYTKTNDKETFMFPRFFPMPWYTPYKNQVRKDEFIEWYFTDLSTTNVVEDLIYALKNLGKVEFNVRKLFADCQYIPQHICVNKDGDNEYSANEVELLD